MRVFKFGGASINSLERIKNTGEIISHQQGQLLIIVSAMGKTTNALEAVVNAYFEGRKEEAIQLFEQVKKSHNNLVKYLLNLQAATTETKLLDFYTEVEWLLYDRPVQDYDYYYDQIVCVGELLSTSIMYHYLLEKGLRVKWIDVRDVLRTDDNFRAAAVDWEVTNQKLQEIVVPLYNDYDIVLTQGFIGSTDENESTTLGREGSDFSAAIFANLMNSESVTIWKDVEAVMSADPRSFPDAAIIPALSYTEVIEMAYYGAQVIHPKTIKPLQNKNIPLYVKSFLDPSLPGTIINKTAVKNLPPVIVVKEKQVLVKFRTLDFSFIEGQPIEILHGIFEAVRYMPNLRQHTAITFLSSFDDQQEKIQEIAVSASAHFDVSLERELTLLTIRHYTPESIEQYAGNKEMVLMQKTAETVQILWRNKIS